ncbi:Retrovirus-related Pol polyprotein from transposon 17.6 [Vitis vinifera]|uniref:Retrovirus-related Pol polyprotein from transposon 17.6 n=1 Tax=Vitis vinifera TaxID=29760 RepID=A0A438DL32_VITVI|nr:Retrovirus-related Pol polyprotein from transposon 17.6 [Vitis vinifera]
MHIWKKTSSALLFIFSFTIHQEDCLLEVLRRCKKAIGWQISYLKGINPLVCTHHIYMEDEAKQFVNLKRLNPHMQEVVRAEVLKLLQAGIIYPISDSPWVSPTQVVPKKSGITVVQNDKGEESLHASLQIEIDVEDQEKTTFTCPFGTYAYRRMPFGLCNAPATFQRCMLSIFSDMKLVLNRCIEKDLVLNWEKCHFMVHQGIVLGHIISKQGIEVDKAKVELIVKLPSPTNVKGVRQFLGHAGFYRRFIKDFSKLARPLCELLVKDAKFIWDDRCQRSFEELKSVLGQREDGKPYVIYYASKTLNEAQRNYTTTEKELLAYLLTKQDAKARLIRWISCFKSSISRSKTRKSGECGSRPPFKASYHIIPMVCPLMMIFQRSLSCWWKLPLIIRKCVPEEEQQGILSHCHENACGGHFASQKTTMRVLQSGFCWPSLFKDAHTMCKSCDRCQRLGKLTRRNMMPLNPILIVDLFMFGALTSWTIPYVFWLLLHLGGVDYVSKWVEAVPCKHNDHRVVLKFLKENIFSRFGVPKAIISDGGLIFATSLLKLS